MGSWDHRILSYVKMGDMDNLHKPGKSHAKRRDQHIAIQSVRFDIFMINTVEGFPMKKLNDYDISPCDVIFSMVEKPKDYLMCKSMNVYDNRWRINVYSKRTVNGIEGQYISQSYFASFDNSTGKLNILA